MCLAENMLTPISDRVYRFLCALVKDSSRQVDGELVTPSNWGFAAALCCCAVPWGPK